MFRSSSSIGKKRNFLVEWQRQRKKNARNGWICGGMTWDSGDERVTLQHGKREWNMQLTIGFRCFHVDNAPRVSITFNKRTDPTGMTHVHSTRTTFSRPPLAPSFTPDQISSSVRPSPFRESAFLADKSGMDRSDSRNQSRKVNDDFVN